MKYLDLILVYLFLFVIFALAISSQCSFNRDIDYDTHVTFITILLSVCVPVGLLLFAINEYNEKHK
jgi:hypothetical protein